MWSCITITTSSFKGAHTFWNLWIDILVGEERAPSSWPKSKLQLLSPQRCLHDQSNCHFDEASDSPSSIVMIYAPLLLCSRMETHMPQLPALLLSSVFGTVNRIPKWNQKRTWERHFPKRSLWNGQLGFLIKFDLRNKQQTGYPSVIISF